MSAWHATWLPWILGLVALHWLVPGRWRCAALPVAGMGFMTAVAPVSAAVLAIISLVCYASVTWLGRRSATLLAVAAAIAVGLLLGRGVAPLGLTPLPDLALLGLAYYALRAIHYVVEGWLGRLPAHTTLEWLAYMWFAPTLPIGPIERFEEFLRELRRLHWDPARFARGLERMLQGYAKVVVVAGFLVDESLADLAEPLAFAHPGVFNYLECLRAASGMYFRFAGYSDVAIGFALALGIKVRENFDAPFLAANLTEFWRRWHMSLSDWCRAYVYTPLMAWSRSPALAAMGAMLAIGLWHGGTFQYLAWGLYHGAGIAACQVFQRVRPAGAFWHGRLWRLLAWQLTFQFVVLSFVITNTATLAYAGRTFRLIFLGW
ncbi:MAG: hypothetical protein JWM80_1404 [Cyanobacteria bacterium RYN_339]|nr:hypothetical protein [Cyanobacteria bacterium RYN_339]